MLASFLLLSGFALFGATAQASQNNGSSSVPAGMEYIVDPMLTSVCPTNQTFSYEAAAFSIPNASLALVWPYFGQWNNETWGGLNITDLKGNLSTPGALRNFTNPGQRNPGTEELIGSFGVDINNNPIAPVVWYMYRNIAGGATHALGNSSHQFSMFWGSNLGNPSVHGAGLSSNASVNSTGCEIGFIRYTCSQDPSFSAHSYVGIHQEVQNVVDYFNGNGTGTVNATLMQQIAAGHPGFNSSS